MYAKQDPWLSAIGFSSRHLDFQMWYAAAHCYFEQDLIFLLLVIYEKLEFWWPLGDLYDLSTQDLISSLIIVFLLHISLENWRY